jgi:hypothetical protein
MTPLRLVTKNPLRVDQLGPTRCKSTLRFKACALIVTEALGVCGESVEAEFKKWLQPMFITETYLGDISQIVYQICRRFKEAKKNCGLSQAWFLYVECSYTEIAGQ